MQRLSLTDILKRVKNKRSASLDQLTDNITDATEPKVTYDIPKAFLAKGRGPSIARKHLVLDF